LHQLSAEIVILILLILANGVFSMSEAAVISARKTRLQQRAENGDAGAQAALKISASPTRFLSTVQIAITLIGILSGAFGGSTVAEEVVEPLLREIPALEPYSEGLSVALVVLVITYLSLVIGELVPKQLALNNPETISSLIARPMNVLSRLTAPIVSVLTLSTNVVLRLLRIRESDEPPVTQEEVEILFEQGAEAGVFAAAQQDIMTNMLRLGDQRVRAVMTPRTDMTWLDLDEPFEVNRAKIVESNYNYYPVFQKDMQHLVGVMAVKELWAQDNPSDLRAVTHDPLVIPSGAPALNALEMFRESGKPIALLLDEHGDVEGLVTRVDLLEALVGDMADNTDQDSAVQRDDGSWLLDGILHIDEIEDVLDVDVFPITERSHYDTLGGFVMMRVGRIPSAGDHFTWQNFTFEVVDMDGRRVDKVLVKRVQTESEANA
jgi:putative hemolysin